MNLLSIPRTKNKLINSTFRHQDPGSRTVHALCAIRARHLVYPSRQPAWWSEARKHARFLSTVTDTFIVHSNYLFKMWELIHEIVAEYDFRFERSMCVCDRRSTVTFLLSLNGLIMPNVEFSSASFLIFNIRSNVQTGSCSGIFGFLFLLANIYNTLWHCDWVNSDTVSSVITPSPDEPSIQLSSDEQIWTELYSNGEARPKIISTESKKYLQSSIV